MALKPFQAALRATRPTLRKFAAFAQFAEELFPFPPSASSCPQDARDPAHEQKQET